MQTVKTTKSVKLSNVAKIDMSFECNLNTYKINK